MPRRNVQRLILRELPHSTWLDYKIVVSFAVETGGRLLREVLHLITPNRLESIRKNFVYMREKAVRFPVARSERKRMTRI